MINTILLIHLSIKYAIALRRFDHKQSQIFQIFNRKNYTILSLTESQRVSFDSHIQRSKAFVKRSHAYLCHSRCRHHHDRRRCKSHVLGYTSTLFTAFIIPFRSRKNLVVFHTKQQCLSYRTKIVRLSVCPMIYSCHLFIPKIRSLVFGPTKQIICCVLHFEHTHAHTHTYTHLKV